MVRVMDSNNNELAPTHPARARKLLKSGRAQVVTRDPFTIRLAPKFPEPPKHIRELVERGATFVVSHSGGKDSQAMAAYVRSFVPDAQILVVHAALGDVEWDYTEQHARKTTMGLLFETVQAKKTFFQMVDARQMWPSPQYRQCTSDLKRGPIEKAVRAHCKATGNPLVVNCMGLRAEESSSRAKAEVFKFNSRNSRAGREWYDWLPIHDWKLADVKSAVSSVGQHVHWAYRKGMTRLSCSLCIMACQDDLRRAATLRPDLYRKYVEKEREIDHTFLMPKKGEGKAFLEERLGIKAV